MKPGSLFSYLRFTYMLQILEVEPTGLEPLISAVQAVLS